MEGTRKRRWLRAPSPAMIVACIALFVALGGTSYAAIKLPANSVGTKQIKNNSVTTAKIKNSAVTTVKIKASAVTGAKVADNSLTGADIQASTLGKVPSAALADAVADGTVGPAKFGTIPGARVERVAAFGLNSGASAYIPYDTVIYNVGGVFNATTPTRMTAPAAGRYLIVASARWASNINGRRTLAFMVNGTDQIQRSNVTGAFVGIATYEPEQIATSMARLNAGDYVEVLAFQDSGTSPLALNTAATHAITFSMEWLAP